MSRQPGFLGSNYCMRVKRTGGVITTTARWANKLEADEAARLAGKWVTLSVAARKSADWSGTTIGVRLITGTAANEQVDMSTTPSSFATGSVANMVCSIGVSNLDTVGKTFRSIPVFVPDGTKSIAVESSCNWGSVAAVDEYVEVGRYMFSEGLAHALFSRRSDAQELRRCQRRFFTTLLSGAAVPPGVDSGEMRWVSAVGATATARIPAIRWPERMISTPTVTIINPSVAANAQIRDESIGGGGNDCSSSTANNITINGCDLKCTSHGGTAAGNYLAAHLTADCR
jgi:hypothetical protein